MKVIYLGRYNDSEKLSGAEKVAKRIFQQINISPVAFIEYFFDGRKYSIWKKIFGYEEVLFDQDKRIYRMGIIRLLYFTIRSKPEIIHIITFERFTLVAFFLKAFLNFKICTNIHGIAAFEHNEVNKQHFSFFKLKDLFLERMIFRYSDRVLLLSKKSIGLANKYYNINQTKIEKIANGIDPLFHDCYESKEVDNRGFGDRGSIRLLFVGGSKRKEKGLEFLLDALSLVNFPVELNIIGECEDELLTSSECFIRKNVYPVMTICEYAALIKSNDIFVSSSMHDSFSIAAAEAMASGLVPIVTNETGLSEYIIDGVNGFVFNYGDKKALLSLIEKLHYNRDLLCKISKMSSEIYNALSWNKIAERYIEIYNRLLL